MDKQTKHILCYIAFGVGLFALLNNLGSVWAVVKTGASFLVPVFGGLLVAFILSVPMKGFENLLLRLLPKAMEQLTESERELIRELFFEGISLREYCRINGIPTMTQHYRLQQVLKKLKNILS